MFVQHLPTFLMIGVVLVAYRYSGVGDWFKELISKKLKPQYDYIIIGGGTAGAVLASRLAEYDNITILLIEAGGNPSKHPDIDIPVLADSARSTVEEGPNDFDWGYETVAQKHSCKGHTNQSSLWHSGKGLGGSSNLNYMLYLRGNRFDYDEWAKHGADGWSYKDVLPYFIKSEDQRNREFVRTVFHGFGGRMGVTDVGMTPANRIISAMFKEVGLKQRDYNGKTQFGWSPAQATMRYGARMGSYNAFLKRYMKKANLYIASNSLAQKIVFEGKKAVGVTFLYNGKQQVTVKATNEVILSAGTVGSAKLLMLSGVGPKAHLNSLQIPVVADLPVGENLQDQVMGDGIEMFSPHIGFTITAARAENFVSAWAYSIFGTGMKASPRFREAIAYIKLRHQPPQVKYPLVALHFLCNPNVYDADQLNVKDSVWDSIHADPLSREGFTVIPVLLHPKSKGSVKLRSKDPMDPPLIDPNYLADDADVKMLTEAFVFARRLINSETLKDWEFRLSNRLIPECAKLGNYTEQYIECHLRHITISGMAPVGTCKMGAANDPHAVVDSSLKVRGLQNLRVVDASVIPSSLSGDTYATQVMIAEKMADALKKIDSVQAIKEYFRHLYEVKHKHVMEEEEILAHKAAEEKLQAEAKKQGADSEAKKLAAETAAKKAS